MPDKFCVTVSQGLWKDPWPKYFDNFINYCNAKAAENNWLAETVINYELKPHGRLIKTKTQGWYLRWDDEKYHTAFVLRWA